MCKRLCAAVLCLVMMLLTCANVIADETVQVSIPVIAWGHDCSVALFDANGQRVQLLHLTQGEQSAFKLEVNGLKRFTYRALVSDSSTSEVTFDRTNYNIFIDVIYGADGRLTPLVSIEVMHEGGVKYGRLEFNNKLLLPPPTPTPDLPVVTPTPEPYDVKFSFRKLWSGDHEDSIDWVMYNSNGSTRSKLFNKKVISENEWYYEAYFQYSVDDCYVIETPIEGYQVIYQNVGKYSDVTDRCYNGGTIINYKLPATGDTTPVADYTALVILSFLGACLLTIRYRRYVMGKK